MKTRKILFLALQQKRHQPDSLLSRTYDRRSSRYSAGRVRGFAALQRYNSGDRAALLSQYRRQTAYLRRQGFAPAFLEPEGRETNEYYLNGFSSSLPLDVQIKALSKVRGFEKVHIYRPGYAIEYDYFPPTQLKHTLETKRVDNLYFAGQINGTTGYEEAAAQGLMAGINASLKLQDKAPFVLARDEAYIGVLIDDLVTKGVDEPYRMFTSRAEYRILLRQDNADLRLTPKAIELGLASSERREAFERKIV